MVRWSPYEILRLTFGEEADVKALADQLFKTDLWKALNTGEMTIVEAMEQYRLRFDLSKNKMDQFFYYVLQTQILL